MPIRSLHATTVSAPTPVLPTLPTTKSAKEAAQPCHTSSLPRRTTRLSLRKLVGLVPIAATLIPGASAGPVSTLTRPSNALATPLLPLYEQLSMHRGHRSEDAQELVDMIFVPNSEGHADLDPEAFQTAIETITNRSIADALYLASVCSPNPAALDSLKTCDPKLMRGIAAAVGLTDPGELERFTSDAGQHAYNVARLGIQRAFGHLIKSRAGSEPVVVLLPNILKASDDMFGKNSFVPAMMKPGLPPTAEGSRLPAAIALAAPNDSMGFTVQHLLFSSSHEMLHMFESTESALTRIEAVNDGVLTNDEAGVYREMIDQALNAHFLLGRFDLTDYENLLGTDKLFMDTCSYATGKHPLDQQAYEMGLQASALNYFTDDADLAQIMLKNFVRALRSPLPDNSVVAPWSTQILPSAPEAADEPAVAPRHAETPPQPIRAADESKKSWSTDWTKIAGGVFGAALIAGIGRRGLAGTAATPKAIAQVEDKIAAAVGRSRNAREIMFVAAYAGDRFSVKLASDVRDIRNQRATAKGVDALIAAGLLTADSKVVPTLAKIVREHIVPESDRARWQQGVDAAIADSK